MTRKRAEAFKIARRDGRSAAQVIVDCVKNGEPERIYTYDELAAALESESEREYSQTEVGGAVRAAFVRLLKEHQRTLYNVRGVGYRLAHANDHSRLALARKQRADVQMLRGLQTLQNVRLEEMDPANRQAHEGMVMVVGAMHQQLKAVDRRVRAIEQAIRNR